MRTSPNFRIGALGLVFGLSAGIMGVAACTQAQTKTALDLTAAACIIANAESAPAEVLLACKLEQAAAPAVVEISRSVKLHKAKMAARPCSFERDAGVLDVTAEAGQKDASK